MIGMEENSHQTSIKEMVFVDWSVASSFMTCFSLSSLDSAPNLETGGLVIFLHTVVFRFVKLAGNMFQLCWEVW